MTRRSRRIHGVVAALVALTWRAFPGSHPNPAAEVCDIILSAECLQICLDPPRPYSDAHRSTRPPGPYARPF